MIRMLITVLISINLFYLAFAQDTIEGRWHLVGYEDNIMYQFEDNYRYSIYSTDGTFGDIEDAGGTPNPYTVVEDIITIDLFFGTIVNYQMNYICGGQVVEFKDIADGTIHSTLFREGYNYIDNDCEECFDFTGLDFGACAMVLGIGYVDGECAYVSGCDWTINGIDYSDLFFDSMDECSDTCFENSFILGDINNDSLINVQDIILLVGFVLQIDFPTDTKFMVADINGDSIINVQDIILLVNIILWESEPEDVCEDIDGNVYETIQIGDQLWMAENLKVTHYNNGDAITHITNEEHWGSMDEGQYGVYDDEPTNANIYGNIYNWAVIGDIRGICPVDWHVPSDDEYTLLTDFLGGESVAGGKMKEAGLEHWNYDSDQISLEATNESGFTGLPAGHRNTNSGDYIYMGFYGYFWSSTENGSDLAWRRYLFHYSSGVARDTFGKPNGFSIRCLRD